MNCDDRQILIEQLLDGELPPMESSALGKHLQDCPACQWYFEQIQSERTLYRTYQAQRSTLDLAPRLWDTIERQLSASVKATPPASARARWLEMLGSLWISPRMSPLAVAVLLIISISVTVLFLRQKTGPDQSPVNMAKRGSESSAVVAGLDKSAPGASAGSTLDAPSGTKPAPALAAARTARTLPQGSAARKKLSPRELVRRAEENYQAAIALLERDFKRRPTPLDDKTHEQFRLALAAIDKNIEEMRIAARRYPDDPQTIQYMLTAYAKKVDLLEEMVGF